MRAYRYGTYSAILGSGASLLYNRTVLPGLLFGISAGTIAGFVQNTIEKLDKENWMILSYIFYFNGCMLNITTYCLSKIWEGILFRSEYNCI